MNTFNPGISVPNLVLRLLGTAAILLSGCQSPPVSERTARLIPAEVMIGEWGGFSEEHDFYLMRLQADGSGLFGYMPYRGEPTLLRISDWQCKKKRLIVWVAPLDQNPKEVQKVEGFAGWLDMTLTVSGPGWQRQVAFHREEDREQRQKVLRARMAAYSANAKSLP